MEERDMILDLEVPLRKLFCGINAIELMVQGMGEVGDPYKDGFHAVWNYLKDAEEEVQGILTAGRQKMG